jgi:hypothetical protein
VHLLVSTVARPEHDVAAVTKDEPVARRERYRVEGR